MAELRRIGTGLDKDFCHTIRIEITASQNEIAAAIGKGATLVVETEADFHVGGQVLGSDSEADDFGAIGADNDRLGIGGFTGAGEGKGTDAANNDDVSCIWAASDGVVFAGIESVGKEGTGAGGSGCGGFSPVEGAVSLDDEVAEARNLPGVAIVGFNVKWSAEIGTADG